MVVNLGYETTEERRYHIDRITKIKAPYKELPTPYEVKQSILKSALNIKPMESNKEWLKYFSIRKINSIIDYSEVYIKDFPKGSQAENKIKTVILVHQIIDHLISSIIELSRMELSRKITLEIPVNINRAIWGYRSKNIANPESEQLNDHHLKVVNGFIKSLSFSLFDVNNAHKQKSQSGFTKLPKDTNDYLLTFLSTGDYERLASYISKDIK